MSLNDKITPFLYMDVDGFYYFDPPENAGCYAAHTLREIADRLDEINKEWNETIERELSQNQ